MTEKIIKTDLVYFDGTTNAYCFCRNTKDKRVFEIKVPKGFNFRNFGQAERDVEEKSLRDLMNLYFDYFQLDKGNEVQYFIVE